MRIWLLAIVFVLSLNLGIAEAIGINISFLRVAIEVLVIALFFDAFLRASYQDVRSTLRWIILPLLATAIGAGVALLNSSDPFEIILFLREMLIPLMVFAVFLLTPPEGDEWKVLTMLLILIAAVQLPVAALKYWTIGSNEKIWIGTFHQQAGQLGLLMPMMAVAFLWAYALKRKQFIVPIILTVCFALVCVVNEKRAVIFVMPALVFFIAGVNIISNLIVSKEKIRIRYPHLLVFSALLLAMGLSTYSVYIVALKNIQSLDVRSAEYSILPKRSVLEYAKEYLTRGYDSPMNSSANSDIAENRNIQLGRIKLWEMGIDTAWGFSIDRFLFGAGGGWLIESKILREKPDDLMFKRLGLRGPASSGFRHFFEYGFVGLMLMLLWMGQIGWQLLRHTSDTQYGFLALGAIGTWAVFVFDYMLYSQVSWSTGVFMPVCFLVVARALRIERSHT